MTCEENQEITQASLSLSLLDRDTVFNVDVHVPRLHVLTPFARCTCRAVPSCAVDVGRKTRPVQLTVSQPYDMLFNNLQLACLHACVPACRTWGVVVQVEIEDEVEDDHCDDAESSRGFIQEVKVICVW